MKKIGFCLGTMALVCTFLVSSKVSNGKNIDSLSNLYSIQTASAEQTNLGEYDKVTGNCSGTVTGVAGTTITWMGFQFDIDTDGEVSVSCTDCSVNCPTGDTYRRADCTTKDCSQ